MTTPVLGVDVGGTGIKLGLVDAADPPRLLAQGLLTGHAGRPPADAVARIRESLGSLCREAGVASVAGIGVGCAGLIASDEGTVVMSPNLPGWEGFPLGPALASATGVPARVDNDVNVFALAEWRWGAGERAEDLLFLTLGTGIGGAVVSGGVLQRGWRGFAGEPGHATLVLDGEPCPCGNRGCAERYVGNKALVDAAIRHPDSQRDAKLGEVTSPHDLSLAADAGSPVARAVLAEAGYALGGLLVTLVNLCNPERIVVGGGVAAAGDRLLGPARTHLRERSFVARHAEPTLVPAVLGTQAGMLGAASLWTEP